MMERTLPHGNPNRAVVIRLGYPDCLIIVTSVRGLDSARLQNDIPTTPRVPLVTAHTSADELPLGAAHWLLQTALRNSQYRQGTQGQQQREEHQPLPPWGSAGVGELVRTLPDAWSNHEQRIDPNRPAGQLVPL